MRARDSILVTGGAGFVGSHFARAAIEAGSRVVVLDDLSSGSHPPSSSCTFVKGDIADADLVRTVIANHRITSVVHFAGKIQVGESVSNPALYWDCNVVRSLKLLEAVRDQVSTFVFSSSAAVYGIPAETPISENAPLAPINPYGATKLAIEQALAAYGRAYGLRWAALRYFNAAGAHADGSLRECHEPETHLLPLLIDAANGTRPPVTIFGDDYDTRDGTCVRDYVHVDDLADAHLAALDALDRGARVDACNLGSAAGFTVREVLHAVEAHLKRPVPHVIGARRPGDPPVLVASHERAASVLGWRPTRSDLPTLIGDAARSRST